MPYVRQNKKETQYCEFTVLFVVWKQHNSRFSFYRGFESLPPGHISPFSFEPSDISKYYRKTLFLREILWFIYKKILNRTYVFDLGFAWRRVIAFVRTLKVR